MRSFVTIIAVAGFIGALTAGRGFALSVDAQGNATNNIGRLSDIAARPLQHVIPPQPILVVQPVPPLNTHDVKFEKILTAEGAIAVDHTTDAILYEKNAHVARPLASITKLMSALIISDHIQNWNATTTIAADEVEEGNQALSAGEVYTVKDLYSAALVGSLNTAVSALVGATGLTRDQFVAAMNQRAKDLGMEQMSFVEPTGLSPADVGTPADVARLLKFALSNPRIKVTSMTDHVSILELKSHKRKNVNATDWLLTEHVAMASAHIEGGKTGYIPEAGYNFAAQIKNDEGHEIRVVVLGTSDVYKRFTETADIAEWIFGNFEWVEAKEKH
ncbi:MAG: serine hydrolase [Candidatus Magasanikbacteria bacterium]|nr:serine hydrolase [Candidatus Magasanikbacteria bacterium]